MAKRKRNWFLPGWVFKSMRRKQRAHLLRARHGDLCWCCAGRMVFDGQHPNAGRAATVEHVLPLSMGGTWALNNLRLCHVGCNRHLADRDPAQKERLRQPLARQLFPSR